MKQINYLLSFLTWVYVMYCPDLPRKFKIGFSGNCERRRKEIQSELSESMGRRVRVWCVWRSPVVFARRREKLLHRIYARFRCNDMPRHSGASEWFKVMNFVTSFIVLFAGSYFHGFRFGMLYAAIFILVELPLDAILLCASLTIAELYVLKWIAYFAIKIYSIS